jgi:predicted metalloprotease
VNLQIVHEADDDGRVGDHRVPTLSRDQSLRWRRTCAVLTVAITVAVLTGCSTFTSREAAGAPTTSKPTTSNPAATTASNVSSTRLARSARSYDPILRSTIASLERTWTKALPAFSGMEYEKLQGGVFAYRSDSVVPACGGIRLPYRVMQQNAFYCPDSDFVAWDDEGLFPKISAAHGEFVLSIVLAHEWGHSIQQRTGALDVLETVIAEQQADCYAGAWAGGLGPDPADRELVAMRDAQLDRALAGLVEFRDLVGFVDQVAGSHGTAFDRIRAFQEGYEEGAGWCSRYQIERPVLVGFSYRTIKEAVRGGDLPFDEALTTAAQNLGAAPLPGPNGLGIGRVSLTTGQPDVFCTEPSVRVARVTNGLISACLDGVGQLYYRPDNMRALYKDFGDFAPATIMALGWAAAAVDRVTGAAALAPQLSESEFDRAVDCLAGAWAGSQIDFDYPEDSELSPGDLDESVQTLLRLASDSGDSGFDRVAAFREGVFTDIDDDSCWRV